MKIALDMDDVLVKMFEGLIRFHDDTFNTETDIKKIDSYHFTDIYGDSHEEAGRKIHEFFESDFSINIAPVDGAQQAVEALSKDNELFVVTARPEFSRKQTLECLDKNFPKKFSSINLTNQWYGEGIKRKKSDICKELGVELIVDDSLKHAQDCAENGIKVLLFDGNYGWNKSDKLHPNITRVHSWKEVLQVIDDGQKRRL